MTTIYCNNEVKRSEVESDYKAYQLHKHFTFDEYYAYCRCLAGIKVGDNVEVYCSEDFTIREPIKTNTVVTLDVIGIGEDRTILIGSKTRIGNLYPFRELGSGRDRHYSSLADDCDKYFVRYMYGVGGSPQGRIAKIIRVAK